jgi:NhaA family Na+:H+ antiporter
LRELAVHVETLDHRQTDEELGGAEILLIEEKLEELEAPLQRFIHVLHPYVAFGVMPVFAIVNSGVTLHGAGLATLATPVALGTALGLFAGKQLGVYLPAAIAVRAGLAPMPGNASQTKLYGVSLVAGIGFTVALFIATLAFRQTPELLAQAKVGILVGSFVSGAVGAAVLRWLGGPTPPRRSP